MRNHNARFPVKRAIRRRLIRYIRSAVVITTAIIIIAGGILIGVNSAKAETVPRDRIYTDIRVNDGDTLWSIAGNIIDGDVRDYVRDLKDINGIVNEYALRSGSYITVYYYI